MKEASSGLYCGPLRLLAMEVYDELNAAGTFCNLVTGECSTRTSKPLSSYLDSY